MISRIEELLRNNQAFVEHQLQLDAGYFDKLAEGQHPEFLWIGCSDSRVPPAPYHGHQSRRHVCAPEHREPGRANRHEPALGTAVCDRRAEGEPPHRLWPLRLRGVKAAMSDAHHGLIDNRLRTVKDTQ